MYDKRNKVGKEIGAFTYAHYLKINLKNVCLIIIEYIFVTIRYG